jgi:tetratricopeptide (TPR) repeat protein
MYALRLGVGVLFFGLWAAAEVRAGVYNLNEPQPSSAQDPPWKQIANPAPPEKVWSWVNDLLLVDERAKIPTGLQRQFQEQAAELEQRKRDGVLVPSERVSLGGCLLRLGRLEDAMKVLEEGLRMAEPSEPARFLLELNLAAAYSESDDFLQRAIDYQKQALDAWPDQWAGWSRAEWAWYRRVEMYTLEWLRLRQQETLRGRGGANPYLLFPKVIFAGPRGQYQAGAIPFEQWNALPRDAEAIVLQLMLWRPQDPRLDWLYGELLNARGEVAEAAKVFERVDRRGLGGSAELRQHMTVLRRSLPVYRVLENKLDRQRLLWALMPHGLPIPAGPASGVVDWAWADAPGPPKEDRISLPSATPAAEPIGRLPDWRVLAVGFLVGAVVTALAIFQWREWRRRSPAPWAANDFRQRLPSPAPDGSGATSVTRPDQG